MELWTERFASAPGIIGQEIEIDGRFVTVIGIAPRGFGFPEGTPLWTPRKGAAVGDRPARRARND